MKTQIQDLINGDKYVRRNLEHPKYINAPKATSHDGFAGTNAAIRQDTAEKVIAENPNGMDVNVCGIGFHLEKHTSCSGKTAFYHTSISLEAYLMFTGRTVQPFKGEGSFALSIGPDMRVTVSSHSRRNEFSQWKLRNQEEIGEEFVEIL